MKYHLPSLNALFVVFLSTWQCSFMQAALAPKIKGQTVAKLPIEQEIIYNIQLIRCVGLGNIEMVRALLERGANVNAKDNDGDTALMWAAMNGHTAVVQLLLDGGANVNLQNHQKYTALMYAVQEGYMEVVELLLAQAKIDINAKNKDNDTALSIAQKRLAEYDRSLQYFQDQQRRQLFQQIVHLLELYNALKTPTATEQQLLAGKAPVKPEPTDFDQNLKNEDDELVLNNIARFHKALNNYWFYKLYTAYHAFTHSKDLKPLQVLFFAQNHGLYNNMGNLDIIRYFFNDDDCIKSLVSYIAHTDEERMKAQEIIKAVNDMQESERRNQRSNLESNQQDTRRGIEFEQDVAMAQLKEKYTKSTRDLEEDLKFFNLKK